MSYIVAPGEEQWDDVSWRYWRVVLTMAKEHVANTDVWTMRNINYSNYRRSRIFYGWWIVAGGAAVMAATAGLNFYGFSAFLVPLTTEFGWSRTAVSAVFSLSRLEGGILGPVEGLLVDRFGPRKMMLAGMPLIGLGFILLSQITSLLELYLVYIFLITLGSGVGSFTAVGAAVANWFVKKRSIAFGVMMSGVAVGGAIFLPMLGWLISSYGWRYAAAVSGAIILLTGIPIAFVMRHRPEDYGLAPDGVSISDDEDIDHIGNKTTEDLGAAVGHVELGPMQSLRTSAFWLLGFSFGLRSLVTTGFTIHFVAMMVDRGFSMTVASSLLGSLALLSIVGRLGLSWLGDIMDKRNILIATHIGMAVAVLAISQVDGLWPILTVLFVYSIFYGGSVVLPASLQADYFGRNAFGTIRGLLHTVQTGGMLLGPVFAGFVYDSTDSYFLAFVGFFIAALLSAVLLLAVREPGRHSMVAGGV